ncbi:hypothetical protein BH10CYA1_BH10CYA1_18280 [soil metagenome]
MLTNTADNVMAATKTFAANNLVLLKGANMDAPPIAKARAEALLKASIILGIIFNSPQWIVARSCTSILNFVINALSSVSNL